MEQSLLYGLPAFEVTRPFIFNIHSSPYFSFPLLLFILVICSALFSVINIRYRTRLWNKTPFSASITDRISNIVRLFLFGKTPGKRFLFSLFHGAMLAALFLYFFTGLVYLLNVTVTIPLFSFNFLYGVPYLSWTFLTDTAGVLILVALFSDFFLRYIVKPQSIRTDRRHAIVHLLLLLFIISGFLSEGLRISLNNTPSFERWSYVGYGTARAVSFLSIPLQEHGYLVFMVLQTVIILLFILRLGNPSSYINIFPLIHIAGTTPEELNTKKRNSFSLNTDYKEESSFFGINKTSDLDGTILRSCDACTECGTCNEVCPAVLAETSLSPRDIICVIKDELSSRERGHEEKKLIPGLISSETIFSCYDCGACNEVCPSLIKPMNIITELKKHSVAESINIPDHINEQFRSLEYTQSINGKTTKLHDQLIESGLACDVRHSSDYDYLLFIGCFYNGSSAGQHSVKNFLKLCKAGGYRIGILGNDEFCCGDTAIRSGNTDLFRSLASKNIKNFYKYGITKIISMCPHGFNVMKNEYPQLSQLISKNNEFIRMIFYTDILLKIIQNNGDLFSSPLNKRVVYHDPCFLGRFNRYYSAPREILDRLTGSSLREMNRYGVLSICCGSSGGISETKRRISYKLGEFRATEGVTAGAEVIATACPYCARSIGEGTRDIQQESISVSDISDIVISCTDL